MSRRTALRLALVIAVLGVVSAALWLVYRPVFCWPSPPKENPSWDGTHNVDPAGDLAKLQGKWRRLVEEGNVITAEFEADVIRIDYVTLKSRGSALTGEYYKYVINSSVEPKRIFYLKKIGPPDVLPYKFGAQHLWYSLEGDVLKVWNAYFFKGEGGIATYKK